MKTHLVLFFGLLLGTLILSAADSPTPPAAPRNADAEKLIDQLVEVNTETVGANAKATTMSKFLANDNPPVISSGLNSATLPPTPPVMRKIVELGVAAVPSLLDHLTDARETKLVIMNPGIPSGPNAAALVGTRFGAIWYNDEYDPRYRDDPSRAPANVNTLGQVPRGGGGPGDSYTVRVGDLCYVLLGQIVNRTLNVARYQGTASAMINSPVQNPALAAAARQDWANLTPEQHQASLEQDATGEAFHRLQFVNFRTQHADALDRLAFYYPDPAKVATLRLLAFPIAEWHYKRVSDFNTKLLAEPDAAARTEMLTTAQKQWGSPFILAATELLKMYTTETPPSPGDASGTLPAGWTLAGNYLVHRITTNPNGGFSQTRVYPHPQWDRAQETLKTVDAQGWVTSLKGHEPIPIAEQISIIKGLDNISDTTVGAACVDLFHRALALRDPAEPTDLLFDQLADACVAQLQKAPETNITSLDEIKTDIAKFPSPATPASPH
jgi:hypothetical protein